MVDGKANAPFGSGSDPLCSEEVPIIVLKLRKPLPDWQLETMLKKARYYGESGEMQAASPEISSLVPRIGLPAWSRGFDSLHGLALGVGGNAAGWQPCGLRPPLSPCDPLSRALQN